MDKPNQLDLKQKLKELVMNKGIEKMTNCQKENNSEEMSQLKITFKNFLLDKINRKYLEEYLEEFVEDYMKELLDDILYEFKNELRDKLRDELKK